MRKQFARLFLSFILVLVVVLSIQVTVFVVSNSQQQRRWNQDIYQSYVHFLAEALTSNVPEGGWNINNIDKVLLSATDGRISGLLLKDTDGDVVTTFGKTREGTPLEFPDRRGRLDPRMIQQLNETSFHTVTAKTDLYVITLSKTKVGLMTAYTSVWYKDKSERKQILLPGKLRAEDIAGSIEIMMDGAEVAKVDVIAFSPFAYQPLSHYLRGILTPFLWSIPVALIIALWMAARISKRNQRYTQGIQSALKDLSEGKHDVTIPKTNIEENLGINQSIKELDKQLSMHEQSRREWLRSISHDLNTPVSSMKLLLDGMADGVFPVDGKRMEMVKKENDELAERINAVVLYSKLISPDAKADVQPIDVTEFVDLVAGQFTSEEWQRVTIDSSHADLSGDPDKLLVACKELLKNALKATTECVRWTIGTNTMVFANLGNLPVNVEFFEPWTKGDASRGTTGNGMGLPIVLQVMNLHEGKATIEQKGKDVVVTISWRTGMQGKG